jgi:hypothetical protein
MKIGQFNSLTDMARKSPHNKQFVDNMKDAASKALQNTIDTLFVNHQATPDQKAEVVSDLSDLRTAMMECVKQTEAAREANLSEAAKAAPAPDQDGLVSPPTSDDPNQEFEISNRRMHIVGEEDSKETYLLTSRSYDHHVDGFHTENSDPMTGAKSFLRGLHHVVGLASAVAALPSGPIAVSVGNTAKEAFESSFQSQSSGSSASSERSATLLGLGRIAGADSVSSHQSSAHGSSRYSRVSSDERLISAVQDLSFQMEQAESRPANEIETRLTYDLTELNTVETGMLFWKGSRQVVASNKRRAKTISETPYEPQRIWLPESGVSEFQS